MVRIVVVKGGKVRDSPRMMEVLSEPEGRRYETREVMLML